MSKTSWLFKISTIICLVVDIAFTIFFAISLVNVLTQYMVLGKIHFILFIVTLCVNIVYIIYLISVLIYNRIKK